MNQTEAAYALVLEARKRLGEIHNYWFELVSLKLGKDVRYTPDFLVFERDGTLTCVEVKAATNTKYALKKTGSTKRIPRMEDDARCKLGVAAGATFPFTFKIAFPGLGGGWEEKIL
jgi:hypothetical protein